MTDEKDTAVVYNINKDYRIVRIKGNKCSLFFKNRQNQLLATLEGCQDIFSNLMVTDGKKLNEIEKGYLISFIRAKKYAISKEVAEALGISIIRYLDGREEYLSEKQLKRRLTQGIDFAKIFIGRMSAGSLKIPADSKECSYIFGRAEINRVVVAENCNINLDFRDNNAIESLVVGERFSGNVNLSRSTIESVFIGNNCRCNLNIADSKRCFNLQIGDIYSGNLNISNSCLYAFGLGYYSYADMMFSNNIIKKDLSIGDAFRGGFYAANQNVDVMKVGDDCKGWIKLNNQSRDSGIRRLIIGDSFAGSLNISGDESITAMEIGRKASGKIDASYAGILQKIKIGKYYSGTLDLNNSSIQNINIAYGASGSLDIKKCSQLKMLQAPIDHHLFIDGSHLMHLSKTIDDAVFYTFEGSDAGLVPQPFYKKIYQNIYNRFM